MALVELLRTRVPEGWPIVVHPDAISDFDAWGGLGAVICIENRDKRKPVGRSAAELGLIFEQLPEAGFCFDIGHARQFDPTMIEAAKILREFGARLRQVHVSEVNTRSKHDRVSYASMPAFREVAHLIPERIPLIVESPVGIEDIGAEIAQVRKALPLGDAVMAA
jgi:hypothetical protein